jgi:hypothetical protein
MSGGGKAMQILILIEPLGDNGYRASSGVPLALSVEAATRDEAVAQISAQLSRKLQNGTEMISVDVPPQTNPWLAMAGMFDPSDPVIKKWKKAMAEYRQEIENDPDYL